MNLIDQVVVALQRSVLPSVIARGGGLRAVAVEDGTLTLEMSGSPGAVVPLVSRIESLIRAAVPEVSRIRIVGGPAEARDFSAAADLTERVRSVLETEVNPVIAAHRGRVTLDEIAHGWVRIRLGGGCQGCSLAEVTVRQGIEPLLRSRFPEILGLVDVTDHSAGTTPFFSAAKR